MIQRRYNQLTHVMRLMFLGLGAFVVLLCFCIGASFLIHNEVISTYTTNYLALEAAGFQDIISSPGNFSDRLFVLLTITPLIGAGLILPIFMKAAYEINELSSELGSLINKNV